MGFVVDDFTLRQTVQLGINYISVIANNLPRNSAENALGLSAVSWLCYL